MRLNITPEPALLGYLLGGPIHGYDLYKKVNRDLGVVWRLSLSQMYAILKTFESRGWIKTELRTQDTRPSQKVLTITPSGRQTFTDWLNQPAHGLREFRVDFFVRLHFARRDGLPMAQRLVDQQIAACGRELRDLKARHAAATTEDADLAQLTRSFRMQQLVGIVSWLERHHDELAEPEARSHPAQEKRRARHPSSRIARSRGAR